ncbi:MAG: hypothetical protein E6188_08480 [Veillonella sp.]|nr:hypothetical protein [Veillonella sp.]
MKKQVLTLLMASLISGTAFAAPGTVTEKTNVLETTVYGTVQDGAVVDRINQLDETVYGTGFNGNSATLSKRVDSLYNSVEGSGTNISLREVSFTVAENVMDGNVLLVPAGTVGSGTITSLKKARSFGRNGALDITFDTIPAIDGTEFTAVQGKEAKDKTRSEVKAAGASVAGAVLLGPVGLVGGAFIKGKNIEYPAGATVYVQPQDSVTIQGLVIGGDGLAHSDDELADAVTVPNTTGESEEYVENNDTDENAAVAEDATAVEEPEEPVENVSQPIVVVKRNQ